MTSTEQINHLIVRNSSVSFVLMGPGGEHRQVIARSDHDNLDLVGLDNPALAEISLKSKSSFLELFTVTGSPPQSLVVHTLADMVVESRGEDRRTTHLTFAWKGMATTHDREKIQEAFKSMAPDIMKAIQRNSSDALEWQLAGLILLCANTTSGRAQARKMIRLMAIFFGFFYILIAATVFFKSNA
ncbi:hypothetical protein ELH56_06285 [Rhizobium ruizarguesonis]|nr:hypothetical protein ELH56_06285 [Rhizobium ruizarguesonis]